MEKVLPFGAWLMKQSRARKINRGAEEPLASYFRGDPEHVGIAEMDVAKFAEYISGWTFFNSDFIEAAKAYLVYVTQAVYELQAEMQAKS